MITARKGAKKMKLRLAIKGGKGTNRGGGTHSKKTKHQATK